MTRHIVMFSGGIGSWATARQVVQQHGPDNVTLLFADVGGTHPSPHVGEDADTYRFINDAARQLGAQLVTLQQVREWAEQRRHDGPPTDDLATVLLDGVAHQLFRILDGGVSNV